MADDDIARDYLKYIISSNDKFISIMKALCNLMVESKDVKIRANAMRLSNLLNVGRSVGEEETVICSCGSHIFKYKDMILEGDDDFFLNKDLEEYADIDRKLNDPRVPKEEKDGLLFAKEVIMDIKQYYQSLKKSEKKFIKIKVVELLENYIIYTKADRVRKMLGG